MKRDLLKLAALALCAAIAGLIFAWSGLFSVAATAGHWPATAWLLHYSLRTSVETHSIGLQAPDLARPSLIARGAGHYETGCAPCHGAPGSPSNRIPNHMVPEPPYLPAVVEEWSPEELFWIVKHGIKYTGMPAWPAQARDDEVWAVTAFLRLLPELTPEAYAELAKGVGSGDAPATASAAGEPAASGQLFNVSDGALIGACARCHEVDGSGRPNGAFPRLDIQSPEYLFRALAEYASGVRPSGIMQPVAAALEQEEMERLARHYAEAAATVPAAEIESGVELLELGRQLALTGDPAREIAACDACHGVAGAPANPNYPALNGQYAEFTWLQLQLWKEGIRGGGVYSDIMSPIVRNMTEEDMRAVAAYYGSLPTPQPAPAAPAQGRLPAAGAP